MLCLLLLLFLVLRGHGEQPRTAASDELVIVCLNSPVKVVSTCWPFSKKGQETELKQMRPFASISAASAAASLRLLRLFLNIIEMQKMLFATSARMALHFYHHNLRGCRGRKFQSGFLVPWLFPIPNDFLNRYILIRKQCPSRFPPPLVSSLLEVKVFPGTKLIFIRFHDRKKVRVGHTMFQSPIFVLKVDFTINLLFYTYRIHLTLICKK